MKLAKILEEPAFASYKGSQQLFNYRKFSKDYIAELARSTGNVLISDAELAKLEGMETWVIDYEYKKMYISKMLEKEYDGEGSISCLPRYIEKGTKWRLIYFDKEYFADRILDDIIKKTPADSYLTHVEYMKCDSERKKML